MQQGPYLITYRKRRSKGASLGVWFVAALPVLAVVGGLAVVQAKPEAAASVSSVESAQVDTSAAVQGPPLAQAAPLKPQAASVAASATTVAAHAKPSKKRNDSGDAVADAALDFPGAPSVKPKSIAGLNPKHKYVAITLDDGYGFQPEMLALLQKYDARCTVFVLGQWAVNNKKALRQLDRAGFEIANHTWDHKDLTKLSDTEVSSQLRRTQKAISAVTGNQAPYMRPPMGATNTRVKEISANMGYKVIMWNRSFADTSPKASPQRSYRAVMERGGGVKPGDIIVGHMGSDDTYEALKQILPELQARGYKFVTVSELIADSKK